MPPVIELHVTREPLGYYGFIWARCSCGAHSKGLETTDQAQQWTCPRALAEFKVWDAQRAMKDAAWQSADPRR